MKEYTTVGLDGATATATLPQGPVGSPLALVEFNSVQVAPPSVLLNRPLPLGAFGPSPPDLKVQPFRRKSHIPAKMVLELAGSIETLEQPVEALVPFKILDHVLPPSVVLYRPRSSLSLQSLPGTATYTILVSAGSTMIFAMRSLSFNPMLVQLSPPS